MSSVGLGGKVCGGAAEWLVRNCPNCPKQWLVCLPSRDVTVKTIPDYGDGYGTYRESGSHGSRDYGTRRTCNPKQV
ncbi:hypothetical protein PoB_004920500 [Plakobranchus ocellatus]|uniref:Uncharacterized protein n=1 Tax=Plakobranchus ocellatus TaxID=259542 RepID=A0AAV4BTS7_9GAST|nr:hypothetical protein PoB_004920500 [Plakobranchus ocellatus]